MERHARTWEHCGLPFGRHRRNDEQRRPIVWHRAPAQVNRDSLRTDCYRTFRSDLERSGLVRTERAAIRRSNAGGAQGPMSASTQIGSQKLKFVDPAEFTPQFAWKK